MTPALTLGIISGIFLIIGYIPYIHDVLKRTSIPSRMSWFIWSLSTATILFGVTGTGTHEAIWVPVADAIGCLSIFILSLFLGTGGWTKVDKISLAICVLSLLTWAITGNIFIALIANLLIYISGYIPTIKKSLKKPKDESFTAWTFFLIGVLLNFVTVIIGTDTGFAVWLYPIVLVLTVGTLYGVLLRQFFVKKS